MKRLIVVTLLFALSMFDATQAGAPQMINYQGMLNDNLGAPVADGSYLVIFTIYDAAAAGSSVWTESQNVTTIDGLFAVLLGSVNVIQDSVFNDTSRFLGIKIGADPEIEPRTRLVTAPYAFRASTIDGSRAGVLSGALGFDDRSPFGDPPYVYVLSEGPNANQPKKLFARSSSENEGEFFYHPTNRAYSFGFGSGFSALYVKTDGSGFVGINTNNPQANLDVSGSLRAGAVELGSGTTRSGSGSTVGGGQFNTASSNWATTAGGQFNIASDEFATVSGGWTNAASGRYATIPGGALNSADGDYSFAAGRRAKATHEGAFVWGDATDSDVTSTAVNEFLARATGGFKFYTASGIATGAELVSGGGSWASLSDRDFKENIRPVSGSEILHKLSQLDISRWNYTTQDASVEHIGPMAQDFYELFGVGDNNRTITTVDPDGIALAAIKALYEKSKKDNKELSQRNKEIMERLTKLEKLLEELSKN